MDYEFESFKEFADRLREVQELVKYASRNEKNEVRYKTFNKSAILLLFAIDRPALA